MVSTSASLSAHNFAFLPGSQCVLRRCKYFAGYIIEKALSIDNIFVFALIFSYFAVPLRYQYRVLFWSVVGALFMRAIFILMGHNFWSASTG